MVHPASGEIVTYVVGYNTFRNRWIVRREQERVASARKKKPAVKHARKIAKSNRPSELIVGRKDGTGFTEETIYD